MSIWAELSGKVSFPRDSKLSVKTLLKELQTEFGCECLTNIDQWSVGDLVFVEFVISIDLDGDDAINFTRALVNHFRSWDGYKGTVQYDFTSSVRFLS